MVEDMSEEERAPLTQSLLKEKAKRLVSVVARLEREILELEDRLTPIMKDFPKEEKEQSKEKAGMPLRISKTMSEAIEKLDEISGRIKKMMTNLEI